MENKWIYYVVGGIVLAHFVFGFVWLVIKMSPKRKSKDDKTDQDDPK